MERSLVWISGQQDHVSFITGLESEPDKNCHAKFELEEYILRLTSFSDINYGSASSFCMA